MGMDIILSAVTHRTGSTLVQRIFNARKETLIWGEHGGVVTEFLRIGALAEHFSIHGKEEREAYFNSGENPNTWIANMTPEVQRIHDGVVHALRAFMETMYADHRDTHDCLGFKEVRYGKPELELLKRCYPDAIVVLLVRHPVHIWKSETSYWSGNASLFGSIWNERAMEYAELHDPNRGIHLVRYEDIVSRDEETLRLLSELARIPVETIGRVLEVNLNSTRTDRSDDDVDTINGICEEGMKRFHYWK